MKSKRTPPKLTKPKDSSCWIYLANSGAGGYKWKGSKDGWEEKVRRELGPERSILPLVCRVEAPKGERRLVLQADNQACRRRFIEGIRHRRGKLRAFAALTLAEKANQKRVYRYAHRHNLTVVDSGDRCVVQRRGAPPLKQPPLIILSALAE